LLSKLDPKKGKAKKSRAAAEYENYFMKYFVQIFYKLKKSKKLRKTKELKFSGKAYNLVQILATYYVATYLDLRSRGKLGPKNIPEGAKSFLLTKRKELDRKVIGKYIAKKFSEVFFYLYEPRKKDVIRAISLKFARVYKY
jgi:hypothetical protein